MQGLLKSIIRAGTTDVCRDYSRASYGQALLTYAGITQEHHTQMLSETKQNKTLCVYNNTNILVRTAVTV